MLLPLILSLASASEPEPYEVAWPEDRTPASAGRPDWLALVGARADFRLVPVRVVPPEPCVETPTDDESPSSCPGPTLDPAVNTWLLVRGGTFSPGPIAAADAGIALTDGVRASFSIGETTAEVASRGLDMGERSVPVDSLWGCGVISRIIVTHRLGSGATGDTLVFGGCSVHWRRLLWAGDLDRDGRLDLVLEPADASHGGRELWLSGVPGGGAVVSGYTISDL